MEQDHRPGMLQAVFGSGSGAPPPREPTEEEKRAEQKERNRLFALIGQVGKERKWKGEYTGIVMKHHTGTDRIDKLSVYELRRFLVAIGSDPDRQIETEPEPEPKKEVPRRGNRSSDQRKMANHQ